MVQALALGDAPERITPARVQAIHRTLLRSARTHRSPASCERTAAGSGLDSATAVYVPPPSDEVPRLLDDVCAFVNRTDVPT